MAQKGQSGFFFRAASAGGIYMLDWSGVEQLDG